MGLTEAGYQAAHDRVRDQRGRPSAHACAHCGRQAQDWAYDHSDPDERTQPRTHASGRTTRLTYSLDPARYLPLCRSCHGRFDHPASTTNRSATVPTLRRAHGPTVLAVRQIRGLTMDTVADRARISPGYLSKIERGLRRPEGTITARLATALEVEIEVLTGQKPAVGVIRDALGIDPVVFAREVGLTPGRLDRIERGIDIPDTELRAVLARRLGVTAEALDPGAFAVA